MRPADEHARASRARRARTPGPSDACATPWTRSSVARPPTEHEIQPATSSARTFQGASASGVSSLGDVYDAIHQDGEVLFDEYKAAVMGK